jgi:hypothetical protein
LNDANSSQTGIEWLFAQQDPLTGQMPYAAPPIDEWGSDTYHLWSMVVLYDTYFYAGGDKDWLLQPRLHVSGDEVSLWQAAQRAIDFSIKKLNAGPSSQGKPGLLWVDHKLDWGRIDQGGYNLAANCIFVRALQRMAEIAQELGEGEKIVFWTHVRLIFDTHTRLFRYSHHLFAQLASSVKDAINFELWDNEQGMYRDNTTSILTPQDGNSLAIWFGVAENQEKAIRISSGLKRNWNEFGAVAPEVGCSHSESAYTLN